MANYCDYEVRVKGSKKAGLMVYESMPCMDFKDFDSEEKVGGSYLITFTGNCKWSVNYGVNDHLSKVNLDSMSESDIEDKGGDYWEYSLRAKSEAFQCEIMVHYWSEESGFDQFDHYKNGKVIKQRKIEYNYEEENVFDWDKTEFVGHEGEYDESVDGEQQNENLMAMLMGLGGMAPSREPEMSDEDQEKLADLTGKLGDLLGQLEGMAAEAGIDLDDGSIGETGYDMYNWTFTEGKTVKGDGWTIAIPDGFVRIDSRDVEPTTGKKRLFELVPVTCKDEDDVDEIPVRILPGGAQDGQGLGDNWMVHPDARAGVAGIIGATTAQFMAQMMGQAPGLLSVGWADVAAHIMVQDTSGGSYSYQCSIITESKNRQLRVQTQYVSDKQKQLLDASVQAWLKTMRFDKPNKACPTKTKFEESTCYDELVKGKTAKFEDAVEQARTEYLASVNGRIKMLEFMGENDLLDEHTGDTIREILETGMRVKLFFLEKADQIIEKLQKNKANASLIENVIEKLADLDEDCLDYNFDDEKIEIKVPKEVQAIRDKWKKIAPNASSAESKELRARMKAIEERKKARAEREKADKTASKIASDIKSKMRTIENTYERNANHHKRMIEMHTFDGPWDPEIREYFSKFDDDIQELGSDTEELLMEAIDSYNEINDTATPKVVISIIEAIEDAIEYVEGASIHNDDLDVTFEYDWNINVSGMRSELSRAKSELKKQQTTLEKEEKKQQEEDRRFEEAQKYGVAEKDLDKHKKYLAAKEKYQKAKKSTDYDAASKEFSSVKGYLDADKLKSECDEQSNKLKPIEKAKEEFDKSSKKYEEANKKVKECEAEYKTAVSEKDKAVSAFDSKKSTYDKDKSDIENKWNREIDDLESKLSDAESRLSKAKQDFDDANVALSKTFALAFGKKKELRANIANLESTISSLEDSVKNYKTKVTKAKSDKTIALERLDKEIKSLEDKANIELGKVSELEKKLTEAKTQLEKAKTELDEKKKLYDSVK